MTNPRQTKEALAWDAFYADEFGLANTTNNTSTRFPRNVLHKSVFTSLIDDGIERKEIAKTHVLSLQNEADPRNNPSLNVPQSNIPSGAPTYFPVKLYLSDAVVRYSQRTAEERWSQPIKVTILHAVNSELNRLGLRTFFQKNPDLCALILVPGIEPPKDSPRFGVAITDRQVRRILEDYLLRDVSFEIKVLAAFSTGYIGLNQAILNELLTLGSVERVVFFDCLYELGGGSTVDAIKLLRKKAGNSLKIVCYESTVANSFERDGRTLSVVSKNRNLITSDSIVELHYNPQFRSLICYRMLDAGLRDALITVSPKLQAAFDRMTPIVPLRGTIISRKSTFKYVYGSLDSVVWGGASLTYFEDWSEQNKQILNDFISFAGSKSLRGSIMDLIWNNALPGWFGFDGAEFHEALLSEFGWEYLPFQP